MVNYHKHTTSLVLRITTGENVKVHLLRTVSNGGLIHIGVYFQLHGVVVGLKKVRPVFMVMKDHVTCVSARVAH